MLTVEPEADNSLSLASNYKPLDLEKEIRPFWEKNQVRDMLVNLLGHYFLLEDFLEGCFVYV